MLLLRFGFLSVLAGTPCLLPLPIQASVPTSVEWVDGESGRMNGRPFRLHAVDAPEIGSVGAIVRGAECESEIERGFEARAFMAMLTRGKPVEMTANYGKDERGRQILDLAVEGQDLRSAGIAEGVLKVWLEEARTRGDDKPGWCDDDEVLEAR